MKRVEEVTGVRFGDNFRMLTEEGSYYYDSWPPCRAQTAIKEFAPEHAIDYGIAMQQALFLEGKDLNRPEFLIALVEKFDLEASVFETLFQSEQVKLKTKEEFEWCKKVGASGFPTLLLRLDDECGILSKGYRPYEPLESHLHHLLNNIEKITG